ncbi:MAG: helix-turn-helix domain-containing protein [Streptococcaceae bacterium]|nr:helix-turn-helix domain-containing protein [Streptococcaceae bacterium]
MHRLQTRIDRYGFSQYISIEKATRPISYKLVFRRQVYARKFISEFFINSSGFKIFNEGLQNPNFLLAQSKEKFGISRTLAANIVNEGRQELRQYDINLDSKQRIELSGKEENIREMLFHFWWGFAAENTWTIYKVSQDKADKTTRRLLELFQINELDSQVFQRIRLRVAIALLRIKYEPNHLNSVYLNGIIHMDLETEAQIYSILPNVHPLLPMSEIRHFIFILLSEITNKELFNNFVYDSQIEKRINQCLNKFFEVYTNLPMDIKLEIKKKIQPFFFRLFILKKVAVAHHNVNYFQKVFPETFYSFSQIAGGIMKILQLKNTRPVHLAAILLEFIKEIFDDKKKKIKIFIDKEMDYHARNMMREELERNFANYFDLNFATNKDETGINLILTTENISKINYLQVNERLSFYDCDKIEEHMQEIDNSFELQRFT